MMASSPMRPAPKGSKEELHQLALDTISVADAVSVAHSTVTNFSMNFKSRFDWLFLSDSSELSEDQWKEKHDFVLDCLAGRSDSTTNANTTTTTTSTTPQPLDQDELVHLWELRELALQPGGLLSPSLRKRAWPKLIAAHETVFQTAMGTSKERCKVPISSMDLRAIQYDVARTIWNVEEHVAASQEQRKAQEEKLQKFIEDQRKINKRVSFSPVMVVASPSPKHEPVSVLNQKQHQEGPPQTVALSPSSETEDSTNENFVEDDPSVLSHEDGENGLDFNNFPSDNATVMTQETAFTFSSRVVRWRKASKQEQKIMFNVITALLSTEAPASPFFEDDNYHYFIGLQDLTALLMINLESPSLTSLVLEKLAPIHLRDALRFDSTTLEGALSLTFMPLLSWVDAELYHHLQSIGISQASFAKRWVAAWYAQDVPDVQLASRLVDVFLVSHPSMPIYFGVALLTHNRKRLLAHDDDLASSSGGIYTVLRGLPMRTLAHDHEARPMAALEAILSTALSYIKRLPPAKLAQIGKNQQTDTNCNNILYQTTGAMGLLQDPPAWAVSDHAPTDWALLQSAKALRSNANHHPKGQTSRCVTNVKSADGVQPGQVVRNVDPKRFPLSSTAIGKGNGPSSFAPRAVLSALALAFLFVVFAVSGNGYWDATSSPISYPFPASWSARLVHDVSSGWSKLIEPTKKASSRSQLFTLPAPSLSSKKHRQPSGSRSKSTATTDYAMGQLVSNINERGGEKGNVEDGLFSSRSSVYFWSPKRSNPFWRAFRQTWQRVLHWFRRRKSLEDEV